MRVTPIPKRFYEIDVKGAYQSRFDQFLAFGIPSTDVVALQGTITDVKRSLMIRQK
jgi:hypothetical protein